MECGRGTVSLRGRLMGVAFLVADRHGRLFVRGRRPQMGLDRLDVSV